MGVRSMKRSKRRLVFDIETEPFSERFRRAQTLSERRKYAPKLRLACVFSEVGRAFRFYTADNVRDLIRELSAADELM